MPIVRRPDPDVVAESSGDCSPGQLGTRYPAELVSDVTTRLGATLHLRPIRADDAPRLVEFHQHLSVRSVYYRFFYVHPKLPLTEIEWFTRVDYLDRLAIVAEDGDQLVAVARYDRIPDTPEAEVAFVVADEYQHHGIATLLLEHLADAAWQKGITTFTALTLAENREMIGVFADSGFRIRRTLEYGTVSIRFSIEPDEVSRAARAHRHALAADQAIDPDPPRC